jgi:hypothetical protein
MIILELIFAYELYVSLCKMLKINALTLKKVKDIHPTKLMIYVKKSALTPLRSITHTPVYMFYIKIV